MTTSPHFPNLSIVIVHYKTLEWTAKCLQSLRKYHLKRTSLPTEIIVVDNGSQDGSVKQLRKQFPDVTFIESEKNLGFAAGNNLALRTVRSKYVLLLNSDTELTEDSRLEELVQVCEAHPEIAVVTPRVLLPSGELDKACHRGEPTLWASFTYFSGLAKRFPRVLWLSQYHLTSLDMNVPHPIAACSGAAMLVRTSAMLQVGYLDERFFMYAEDLDWCKRFREAGHEVWYWPTVSLFHHKYKSGVASQDAGLARQTHSYFYETMLQYFDKHYRKQYPELVRMGLQFVLQHYHRKGAA